MCRPSHQSTRTTRRDSTAGLTLVELCVVLLILLVAANILCKTVISTVNMRKINHQNRVASKAAQTVMEYLRSSEFALVYVQFNEDPNDDPDGDWSAPGHLFDVPGLAPLADAPHPYVGEIIFPSVMTKPAKGVKVEKELSEKEQAKAAEKAAKDPEKAAADAAKEAAKAAKDAAKEAEKAAKEAAKLAEKKAKAREDARLRWKLGRLTFPGPMDDSEWELREVYVDEALGMPRDLNGDNLQDELDRRADYVRLPVCVRVTWDGPNGPQQFELHSILADYTHRDQKVQDLLDAKAAALEAEAQAGGK